MCPHNITLVSYHDGYVLVKEIDEGTTDVLYLEVTSHWRVDIAGITFNPRVVLGLVHRKTYQIDLL